MWISYDYLHDCNVKFEYGLKPKIIVWMWEGRKVVISINTWAGEFSDKK